MITSELKEYIKQNDVEKVRKELLAIFNSNPNLGDGDFRENLNYALKKLGDNSVYQPCSGEFKMKEDVNEWTSSYVAKIFLQLRKEFSKELVLHLEKVAPVVYKGKELSQDRKQQASEKELEQTENGKNRESNDKEVCIKVVKWVIVAAAAGVLIAMGINLF